MIYNIASSILTTTSNTRINTFFAYACFALWTFLTDYTFWATVWWISNIISDTRTNRSTSLNLTDGVWSTRRWRAWIIRSRFFFVHRLNTIGEWITFKAYRTTTNRIVIDHNTLSVNGASSWTRVDTFLVDASLCLGTL